MKERNYFRAFRVTNDIYGEGLETIRVVEEAVRLNERDGPYDQIWCVFDRDSFPADNFDNAIHKVKSLANKGFRVAYSNESFELWYLLHFEYLHVAVPRTSYIERLHLLMGRKYKKGDSDIHILLQQKGSEENAIRYAQRLRDLHEEGLPFSRRCPETTIDELVQVLRKVQKSRGY